MTLQERFDECIAGPWETGGDNIQFRIEDDGAGNLKIFFQYTDIGQTRDIINDLDFPAMLYRDENPKWFVHRGFMNGFKSVIDIIGLCIATTKNGIPAKSIYIAGFSAGGAYATMMHEWCLFHGWNPETWTYGAPRVLYMPPASVRARFLNLHRVHDFRDIVTHLPPWGIGFCHVGQSVRVGKLGWPTWHGHQGYRTGESLK